MRGLGKLLGRNPNSFSTLCISAWVVGRTPLTSGAIECCELRRTYTPITPSLSGYNMEMEVRCFLSAKDAVVLERKYPEGFVSLDERLCDPLGRDHYRRAFLVGKVKQRRDMPTCDDAALANFELPRIDHGERMFAFIDDCPPLFATCHPFTKVAWISYGKLDQLSSPIQPSGRLKEQF